jgi:hypothetical protein
VGGLVRGAASTLVSGRSPANSKRKWPIARIRNWHITREPFGRNICDVNAPTST